jgi:hypothetical protein
MVKWEEKACGVESEEPGQEKTLASLREGHKVHLSGEED